MKRLLIALACIGLFTVMGSAPAAAADAGPLQQLAVCGNTVESFLGLESWDSCLRAKYNEATIRNINDIWLIVFPLIEGAIKILGYVAVGFIVWGSIKYLKSQGEPAETAAGRQIIHNAVMGLVIVVLSVALVQFVAGVIK